ncbi:CotY/CotZ family spore coat protein [Halobacillus kuroshimensis]|uniref:CotY/CotZ family spore coat protein n=1 Tax=Halobacillus kuroshimensis TaxID=302481 RepID=UPI0003FD1E37|nr:CotY/CotZ family spore coat protein [Halobacillus kuroshimensis]
MSYDYESSSYGYDHKHKDHCGKSKKVKHYKNCVEDVLEAIVYAQDRVEDDSCHTSCQQSIDSLLGDHKVKKNTVPVILYCGCDPFKGTGVTTYSCHAKKETFKCVHTYLFKVKDVHDGCAVLELLVFKSDWKDDSKQKHSACSQIDGKAVRDLAGTGICITVDLSCFCAVTCLPAVRLH